MTGNIFGDRFKILSFGESHGKVVGVVIDGCPAGLKLNEKDIQKELDLRKPFYPEITTTRFEKDKVEILSGVFRGYTTGAPIAMIIKNRKMDSRPYMEIKDLPRPGHADYPARVKYRGYNDYRGGGRFSGRITASFVMAGAIAKKILKEELGIETLTYTYQVGKIRVKKLSREEISEKRYSNPVRCPESETAEKMKRAIIEAKKEGDSLGGVVAGIVYGLPVGLGEPVFQSLESELSKGFFSIPAVKAVEFGAGFKVSEMKGSENNDQYVLRKGKIVTLTNNAGGVLGGLSTGMPLTFKVFFKPTPSISKPQNTVNLKEMKEEIMVLRGRHDPCIVPRAVPVVESITNLVIVDNCLKAGVLKNVL